MGRIRIISIPDGEAPESVRREWVGLELPHLGQASGMIHGILSKRSHGVQSYWGVPQDEAIRILEQRSPDAARWFREHGFPAPGMIFTFQSSEVQYIAD